MTTETQVPVQSLTVSAEAAPAPKKRGRPAGVKKTVAVKKTKKPAPTHTEADWNELIQYSKFLQLQNEAQAAKLDSYAHKEIQTQAVISYLEAKLELQ